jgi:hypothetical protein
MDVVDMGAPVDEVVLVSRSNTPSHKSLSVRRSVVDDESPTVSADVLPAAGRSPERPTGDRYCRS